MWTGISNTTFCPLHTVQEGKKTKPKLIKKVPIIELKKNMKEIKCYSLSMQIQCQNSEK